MNQLYFVRKGKLEWRESPTPTISTGKDALVRPFAVAKCDLDDAFLFDHTDLKIRIGRTLGLVDPNYKTVFGNLMKGPFPFGHECVGQVVEIGDDVKEIKIGDVVSVPFQISCGSCENCSRGLSSTCTTVKPISTYGFGKHLEFGGAMSDVIRVPYAEHMLTKIPDNLDPIALASLSDNIPDAYRHIQEFEENSGRSVLIISGKAKSVGIYSLVLAKAIGVPEVDFVDNDVERIQLAKKFNAANVYNSLSQISKKYDLVIDASSTEKGLKAAFRHVRNFGTVSSSGIYIRKTPISFIELYAKGINFKIGLTNAREYTERILNLVREKNIDFGEVTTKTDKWDNAINAFLADTTKVVVIRDRISIT